MRTSLLALLAPVLLFGVACRAKEQAAPPKPSASATPAPVQSAPPPPSAETLARRFVTCWETFNRNALEELGPCYAEDAVSRWPDSGFADETGRRAIIENRKKGFKTAFPDGKVGAQIVLVNGLDVAATGVLSGTQTGPFMAREGLVDATKKPIGQLVFSAARFDTAGLVKDETFLSDRASMLFQLGVSKRPGRPRNTQGLVNAPIIVKATGDVTESSNLEVVAKRWRAFGDENLPAVVASFADDVILADQTAKQDARGKGAAVKATDEFLRAFSQISLECPTRWAAGTYVVSVCRLSATNDGDFGATKATGQKVSLSMAEIARLDGGLEKEIFRFADGARLATDLTVALPAPSAAPSKAAP